MKPALKTIQIDIPALRSLLVELMKIGENEISLEELLFYIKASCLVEEK